MDNKYKEQFALSSAAAFQQCYPDIFDQVGEKEVFSAEYIYENIEKPKDPTMGRYSFPVFRFGKLLKEKPPEIAAKISAKINSLLEEDSDNSIINTTVIAAFINIQTDFALEASEALTDIINSDSNYGDSDLGNNKKVLVEYSAPNIAKPFGIGHIRTTILGNSLRLIYKKLGYDTVGINYLGDWGTQFGKMICAYKKWADPAIKGKETVENLLELYVRFHEEADKDSSFEDEARAEFKKLEQGDAENSKLWEDFRKISIDEFDRVYKLMGVEFDWVTGEAYLNDKMEPVIDRLDKNCLVTESQGATIVDLQDEHIPPALLKKADGATLYLTRDIAGYLYRYDKYRFDKMLYVVAINQSVHFQQMFKVIDMLEDAENTATENRIGPLGEHVEFGMIKFGDKLLSTRRGNIIFLEDVISKAAELAKEKISEKNPDLKEIDATSHMIGLGAVMFSQMSVRRQKDVNFNWDDVLSFEGETGPYLQYTHARLSSLIRIYNKEIKTDIDFSLLNKEEEKRIVEALADFPEVVTTSAEHNEPYFISAHLLKIAASFNKFYQRKDANGRIDKIISENSELTDARLALVKAVQIVVKEGLYLLGIQAPEEM